MRARNIKPGFYKNADLAECSLYARLLAPGLWMMADREGRLEDRPKQIKGEVFPYDDVNVDPLLDELQRWNHIVRYQVGGKRYIQVLNFKEHQTPHIKEKQSDIPSHDGSTSPAPVEHQTHTENAPDQNPLIPDSGFLIPDNSPVGEGGASPPLPPPPPPGSESKKSKQAQPSPTRGTRLKADWTLPQDWGEWAESQGMTPQSILRERDKFRDYWRAKAGSGGSKADWEATWRNWIRRHLEEGENAGIRRRA